MKRFLPLMLSLVFCFVLSVPSVVSAAPSHPLSYTCSSNCYGYTEWDGTQEGANFDSNYASNPNTASNHNCWQRSLNDNYTSWSQNSIFVALVKANSSSTCGFQFPCAKNDTLYAAAYAYDYVGNLLPASCTAVPPGGYNTDTVFTIYWFSNGNCWAAHIIFSVLNDVFGTCFAAGNFSTGGILQHIRVTEQWQGTLSTNSHWVYGVDNSQHDWLSTSGLWMPQTNGGLHGGTWNTSNPPQMYWQVTPTPGGSGGDMYDCIYDPPAYPGHCTLNG